MPTPGHGRWHLPHLAAGLKAMETHHLQDFSSRTHPPRGGPLRVTPPKRGLSEARTAGPHATHGWHTIEALVTRCILGLGPRDHHYRVHFESADPLSEGVTACGNVVL